MCVSNVQCLLLSDFNCKWDTKVCSVGFNENALSSSQVCTCKLKDGERDGGAGNQSLFRTTFY